MNKLQNMSLNKATVNFYMKNDTETSSLSKNNVSVKPK